MTFSLYFITDLEVFLDLKKSIIIVYRSQTHLNLKNNKDSNIFFPSKFLVVKFHQNLIYEAVDTYHYIFAHRGTKAVNKAFNIP